MKRGDRDTLKPTIASVPVFALFLINPASRIASPHCRLSLTVLSDCWLYGTSSIVVCPFQYSSLCLRLSHYSTVQASKYRTGSASRTTAGRGIHPSYRRRITHTTHAHTHRDDIMWHNTRNNNIFKIQMTSSWGQSTGSILVV